MIQVMVVGSGGREHALAWKLAQSRQVSKVYVAPGNAGTQREPGVTNIPINAQEVDQLAEFAYQHSMALTVVGPENALASGIVDLFQRKGLAIIGPTRAAARLESSKVFSKDFMHRHRIPTAQYQSFVNTEAALDYLNDCCLPIVIKADGLAAGKGVLVVHERSAALAAARKMMLGEVFGGAGRSIVIEECLEGKEASFICLTDGVSVLPLASSQDHKARDDGGRGPNTGGMGAFSPAVIIDDAMQAVVMQSVVEPCIRGMRAEGNPFSGFLYAGLMIGNDGKPRVLEFNCRLGDPEAQVILFRMRSDLAALLMNLTEGRLGNAKVDWDTRTALNVVMASSGYPDCYRGGHVISGLEQMELDTVKVFHAGTSLQNGRIINSGGRVLGVTALAATTAKARSLAYDNCAKINWEGAFYRTDIGARHQAPV